MNASDNARKCAHGFKKPFVDTFESKHEDKRAFVVLRSERSDLIVSKVMLKIQLILNPFCMYTLV